MKISQQKGYLLHHRPYRESSMLLDVFTRNHGRLTLISKGARRKKSHVYGLLMPFLPVTLSWAGKGDLPILTSIEQGEYFKPLESKLFGCGYYMNELLLKLLHRHDPHEILFDRYNEAIIQLARGDSPFSVLRVFEKYLLQETGFGLVLDHDVDSGEAISPELKYNYQMEKGPVVCSSDERTGISGSVLIALQNERFENDTDQQVARKLTRQMLDMQLSGKKLKSRKIQQDIKRYEELFGT